MTKPESDFDWYAKGFEVGRRAGRYECPQHQAMLVGRYVIGGIVLLVLGLMGLIYAFGGW